MADVCWLGSDCSGLLMAQEWDLVLNQVIRLIPCIIKSKPLVLSWGRTPRLDFGVRNGWMSFSKRSNNAPVCYMKPLDSLKNWNDHFFWVDSFACPALFSWHTTKNVTRDPAPLAADFNAQDYATLVAHPSLFRKFPEEFLCLVGLSRDYTLDEETYPWFFHKNGEDIDLFAFIHTPDPTKVKVVEREQVKDEPLLLQITVGRTVPLLLVALDRAESEMEASVDKFFDEGGSGNQTEQGGSTGSGRGVDVQLVSEATDTVAEDVAPLEDHGTPSGPSVAGKSRFVQRLLAGAVLNANVRAELPIYCPIVLHKGFVISSYSVVRPNLQTINALQRFIISLDFSHHSGANVAEAKVDSLVKSSVLVMAAVTTVTSTVDPTLVVKEKPVKPSLFSADSSSAGGADPNTGVFLDLSGSEFLIGGIRTVINPDTDHQKTYVPQWSVTNGSRLDDGRVCREMVDEFSPPKFFASYEVLKVREGEIDNLKAHMLLKEVEAAEAIHLRAEASNFEIVEKSLRDEVNALKERNTILEKEQNALDVKVTDLEASVVDKERKLSGLNAQLTSVKSQNDNLVDQVRELELSSSRLHEKDAVYEDCMGQLEKFQDDRMKEVNDKFYKLYADFIEMALYWEERAAIGKAIKKGMQDGLSAGITHGGKLRSNKDASVDTLMNILRLEETLAERLVVVGATALSLALDVSNIRVQKIRENITSQRSALRDVFVPLSEPFSAKVLTGAEGTSDNVPATSDTTTALSTTLASASTIAPISVDDYEVVGTDDQAGADGDAKPFPNVDDSELNIP
ncbi:hypothetical protein Tco_0344234 [Tanacetum coccineum]